MKVSFIIPVFNEANRLPVHLPLILSAIRKLSFNYELIIVNDGSTDQTVNAAEKLVRDDKNAFVVGYGVNKGKGEAFRYGFRFVTGDYVVLSDVDIPLTPGEIDGYLQRLEKYDIVMASKRHPNSKVENWPIVRRDLSRIFNILERIFLRVPFTDTQCGIKFFKKKSLEGVIPFLNIKQYAFDAELLFYALRNGLTHIEMPVNIRFEKGHVNVISVLRFIKDFMGLCYRTKFGHRAQLKTLSLA